MPYAILGMAYGIWLRLYSEFKNALRSALWAGSNWLNWFLTNVPPTPAWRWIASLIVRDRPSCINSARVRRPHSGGVRTMFLYSAIFHLRYSTASPWLPRRGLSSWALQA